MTGVPNSARPAPMSVSALLLALLSALLFALQLGACSRGRESTAPAGVAGTIPGASSARTNGSIHPDGTAESGDTVPEPATKPAVAPVGKSTKASIQTPDGRERTYHVYVPASLPADLAVPLLIAMHGGTGWGEQFERASRFDGIAEANQFIVAYPDGIEIGPAFPLGRVWNGGDCCGPAAKQEVDDVRFISMVIDSVSGSHRIDPKRVYAAGHSNGGIMSYRLACELADKVVAVGLQAGWLAVDSCNPSKPVSVLHIHGAADENAPIDGGRGSRSISGVDARPAADGVRTIAAANRCPSTPARTEAGDFTTELWSPCRDGTEVQLVKVRGASHGWMGSDGNPVSDRIVGEPYQGLDASAEIWTFLAAHPRA